MSQRLRFQQPDSPQGAQAHACRPTGSSALAWPCAVPGGFMHRRRSDVLRRSGGRCMACRLWLVAWGGPCCGWAMSEPPAKQRRGQWLQRPARLHQQAVLEGQCMQLVRTSCGVQGAYKWLPPYACQRNCCPLSTYKASGLSGVVNNNRVMFLCQPSAGAGPLLFVRKWQVAGVRPPLL